MSVSNMSDTEISKRMDELAYCMNNCGSSGAEDRYQREYSELLDEQLRRKKAKKQSTGTDDDT